MDASTFRRTLYGLLASLSLGITVARIIGLEFVYEPSMYHAYPHRVWPATLPKQQATFSSNDRSRWSTVRSLVEGGTFVIGRRIDDPNSKKGYRDEGILFEEGYRSIDVMMNPETKEFFSTKPPLFTIMVAGEYGLLYRLLGLNLDDHPWPVVCTILITFNVLPLLIFLILLARLLEEYGKTDWGRIFVFATACLGTFLTTFSVTLNNHTPGACCVMFALYPLLAGRASGTNTAPDSFTARFTSGFFAGMSICLDLPAAAFAGSLGLFIVWTRGSFRPLLVFVPAMLIPVGALVATNYLALGDWKPAYANFGGPWYEYEGSHWLKAKQVPPPGGIDFADEPKSVYAFHLLLGHHGLFSLTPVWFFALAGILGLARGEKNLARLSALTLLIFVVVAGFYIWKTNNYGGFTSGPRWLFWLTPLFLLGMIPVTDRLAGSRKGRGLAYLFLAMSAFSAFYPVSNPWRHPWIYQLCEHYGWIRY